MILVSVTTERNISHYLLTNTKASLIQTETNKNTRFWEENKRVGHRENTHERFNDQISKLRELSNKVHNQTEIIMFWNLIQTASLRVGRNHANIISIYDMRDVLHRVIPDTVIEVDMIKVLIIQFL